QPAGAVVPGRALRRAAARYQRRVRRLAGRRRARRRPVRGSGGAAMVSRPVLAGFGVAQPATAVRQDELWDGYFARHFANSAGARRVFFNAGVRTRYAVANPLDEDI